MGRVTRALAGLVSIAALAKLLSRRRRHQPAPAPTEPDPAAELRRKLDEARAASPAEQAPAAPADAPPATVEPDGTPSLDERRESVHERAQQTIDAMRRQDG